MGKFLNGVAIGALATLFYKKQKKHSPAPTEKTPLQNLVHSTKQVKIAVDTLTKVALPETLNVIDNIKKSLIDFTIQEQPRVKRTQHYISILQQKGK